MPLLNAKREIQVGNTVYRYFPNGVAKVESEYILEIDDCIDEIQTIEVTELNAEKPIPMTSHLVFIPYNYFQNGQLSMWDDEPEGDYYTDPETDTTVQYPEPIILSDGTIIPGENVREVNYNSSGDGGWLHKLTTGLFGRNTVAIKKFTNNKKLVLNLYDQNYIIYSNIGTHLKMQKKVFGIWWNIKAEEMEHGWDVMGLAYKCKKQPIEYFVNPNTNKKEYPTHAWNPFPMGTESRLLFTIPIISYNFTTKDLNRIFKSLVSQAYKTTTNEIRNLIGNNQKRADLMSFSDREILILNGHHSTRETNTRSMQTKFFAKWFPGDYKFGFSFGSSIQFKSFKIDPDDGVRLDCGVVYGAIKYNGKWIGARIYKTSKIKNQ